MGNGDEFLGRTEDVIDSREKQCLLLSLSIPSTAALLAVFLRRS